MARNTQVEADHDAPPVTQILAKFVATHPSRGWSEAVDHEAHRTFLNWVGCAVGAARHEVGAKRRWRPCGCCSPRRRPASLGPRASASTWRARRWSTASPRTPSISTTRTCKTIIHPGRARWPPPCWRWPSTGASGRAGDRRAGAGHRRLLPHRQLHLPGPLRPRLAHHRLHRHARRGRRLRAPAGPGRAAHRDGAGHRRVAADRHARAVRHHDQALPSGRRGARGPDFGAAGASTASPRAPRRWRRRAAMRRWSRPSTTGTRSPTSWASASRSRSTPTSPSPAAS